MYLMSILHPAKCHFILSSCWDHVFCLAQHLLLLSFRLDICLASPATLLSNTMRVDRPLTARLYLSMARTVPEAETLLIAMVRRQLGRASTGL